MLFALQEDAFSQLISRLFVWGVLLLLQEESSKSFVKSASELVDLLIWNDRFAISLFIIGVLVVQQVPVGGDEELLSLL